MEREANYVAVGAFVLLVAAMGILFVYWYSDSREHHDYVRYEVYFDGSVSGLTVGGQVRYLGVDVGRVARIRLDPRAASRVQVQVDVDSTAPVNERTLAQLSLQGVTGLLFIDLQQQKAGEQAERVMQPVPSEHYPVIRSIHSGFDVLLSSLPEMAGRISELATRGNEVLSDDNIARISRLMASLEQASATLPQTARDAGALMLELRGATAESRAVITQLHEAVKSAGPDLAATLARTRDMADHLAAASAQLDGMLAEDRGALKGFVHEGLPQLESLARDVRAAAQEFRQLSRGLKENPSRLLYKPVPAGVEIPP